MNVRPHLVAWLLPALLLAGCGSRPVAATLPVSAPSAGGGVVAASPTAVPATATDAPSATPTLAVTDTPAALVPPSEAPSLVPSDTPLPPTDTPLPASPTAPPPATNPPATEAGDTTLPDTVVPPTSTGTSVPPLSTSTSVPPSASPSPSPSPAPPDSTQSPGQTYVVYSEQVLGEYVARVWVRADNPFPDMLTLGTIDRGAERLVQIGDVAGFELLPAGDLTGEGQLDVAFALRWGGSHCCWGTVLYNLGETPQQVLWVGGEIGAGTFQDLDGDGDWEFITRDRLTGLPCTQPSPLAVLAYSPAQGYAPASPQYPAAFEAELEEYTAQAEARLQANGAMTQCDVTDLMLDYLYSGQAERGWAEFARLYTAPDAADYRAALEKAAAQGQLYIAATP